MKRQSETPAVTVIIPAYNYAHFLGETIESVLAQTFTDFEVVVVDDGSTDNTQEVCESYLNDGRVRYIYQENQGLAATRNTGLRAAQAELVTFLDADDVFSPDKLAVQVDYLRKHAACDLVAGGFYYMDEHSAPMKEERPWLRMPNLELVDWLYDCPIVTHSILVKKYWLDQVGGFDKRLRRVEDWDLWLRLAHAGCKMEWVKEIVGGYRVSPGQMTRNAAAQKRVSVEVMDRFFAQPDLPPDIVALKSDVYTRLYLVSAGREYGAEQCEDAKESVAAAIQISPELVGSRQIDLINRLLSWTANPFVGDPIKYTERVFDNLPAEAWPIYDKKKWALSEIALRMLFSAHQKQDWRTIQRSGKIIAKNAPRRLLNRGVISILWQSFINKNIPQPSAS